MGRVYCRNLLTLLHGKPWELQSGGNFSLFLSLDFSPPVEPPPSPTPAPPVTMDVLKGHKGEGVPPPPNSFSSFFGVISLFVLYFS